MDWQADSEALRSVVREVLRDLVPDMRGQVPGAGPAPARATHAPSGPWIEEVSIASDADLQAFVRQLMRLFRDPSACEAIRAGRHVFRLADKATGPDVPRRAASPEALAGDAARLDKGVLSESKVIGLARAGQRIVLGRRVVVTPLATDKARQLGVKLERET